MALCSEEFVKSVLWQNSAQMELPVACEHHAAGAEGKFFSLPGEGALLCGCSPRANAHA